MNTGSGAAVPNLERRKRRFLDKFILRLAAGYIKTSPWRTGKGRALVQARLAALRLGETDIVTRHGTRLRCDARDLIQRSLMCFGIWEPELTGFLSRRLRPGDLFVDVGANIGYYTVLAARIVGPHGGCVSIEASPTIHRLLERNVALNRLRNVRTINMAASDRCKEVRIYLGAETNIGASTLRAERGYTRFETVQAAPLTAMLTPEEIRRARVVKIDVEGAEQEVLDSLFERIDEFPLDAVFVVELAPTTLRENGSSLAAQVARFEAQGFTAWLLEIEHPDFDYLEYSPYGVHGTPIPLDALTFSQRETVEARSFVDVVFCREAL